jgi:hypothetical protein
LALTSDLGSKKIHAIVSYTDGYGTLESVTSSSSTPFKAAGWTRATAANSSPCCRAMPAPRPA